MSSMTINGKDNSIFKSYSHISSGKRINSAADDAAGLAIAKKMQREETGLSVGAENAKAGIGVLNVADGALDGMTDYLQRIRDLALRSMNGLNSADDKKIYQNEIDQLKQGIQSLAKDTSLNEQKLLDGSMADMGLATNPNGGGMKIQMANATLEALGIADLDVTSDNFSLDAIDKALDMVSSQRSSIGAYTNRLEHTFNYNNSASLEQLSARSRLEDLDFPKAISEKQQKEVMNEYRMMMLRRQMSQKSMMTGMLF
ncbi:MAG: flagellin [Lachnospiraceae bacterium]|nr:flagellin [Lachnospiraceae bacterium]